MRMYLREIEGRQRRESKKMIDLEDGETGRETSRRGWEEKTSSHAHRYTTAQTLHLRHSHDLHNRHCVYFY